MYHTVQFAPAKAPKKSFSPHLPECLPKRSCAIQFCMRNNKHQTNGRKGANHKYMIEKQWVVCNCFEVEAGSPEEARSIADEVEMCDSHTWVRPASVTVHR